MRVSRKEHIVAYGCKEMNKLCRCLAGAVYAMMVKAGLCHFHVMVLRCRVSDQAFLAAVQAVGTPREVR